jgi:hypothetical protein
MFVIQNPTTEIEKIAVFLNVKNSTEFYAKVAESCSFEKLKQYLIFHSILQLFRMV